MNIQTNLGTLKSFDANEEDQIVSLLQNKQISPDDLRLFAQKNQSGLYWITSEIMFEESTLDESMIDRETFDQLDDELHHFGLICLRQGVQFYRGNDEIIRLDRNDRQTETTFDQMIQELKTFLD